MRCLWSGFLFLVLLVALGGTATAVPTTVPTELNPGDQYRLVFVTSTTIGNARSTNIAVYNTFVASVAESNNDLKALGTTWMAIASTTAVDARDNTSTNPGTAVGVPIYLLNDTRLAKNNADLWDNALPQSPSITEDGSDLDTEVWTGSTFQGIGFDGRELGSTPTAQRGCSGAVSGAWMACGSAINSNLSRSMYAISANLTVVPEPSTALLLASGLAAMAVARVVS